MRAAADRYDVGIALHEAHPFERDAEPLTDALGKARFVPLAARQGTDNHIYAVVGADNDLGPFARVAHSELDVVCEPNTPELAALLGFFPPPLDCIPLTQAHRMVHDALILAAVVSHPGWIAIWQLVGTDQISPPQLDRIEGMQVGSYVDQPLDHKHGFR